MMREDSTKNDGWTCRSIVANCVRGTSPKKPRSPPPRVYDVPSIHLLPEALAAFTLSFLPAKNICSSVRLVNKLWRMISHDNGLWRILCLVNEKGPAMPEKPVFPWEIIYMGNPHVPNDFDKIGHAAIFARQSSWFGGRVFVAEGEYRENLVIVQDMKVQATESAKGKVSIVYETTRSDVPILEIKAGRVRFTGVNFVHSCRGHDIWNGNSAVYIKGAADVAFVDCDFTSRSGRGVVATRGAQLMFKETCVHDCAATGVYVGGDGTTGEAVDCIVKGNGKGGERVLRGHSGIFVDRAEFKVKGTSIVSNHLTGMSLVGEGASCVVEDCVIAKNATIPIDAAPGKVEFRGNKNDVRGVSDTEPFDDDEI